MTLPPIVNDYRGTDNPFTLALKVHAFKFKRHNVIIKKLFQSSCNIDDQLIINNFGVCINHFMSMISDYALAPDRNM